MSAGILAKPKAKKRSEDSPAEESKQIGVRYPMELVERIEACAESLGTDASHLLRMLAAEFLPEFEARAKKARKTLD